MWQIGLSIVCDSPSNIRDVRRRIHIQLPVAFPEKEFDGAKIFLVHVEILFELSSREGLKMRSCVGGLHSRSAKTPTVQTEDIFL